MQALTGSPSHRSKLVRIKTLARQLTGLAEIHLRERNDAHARDVENAVIALVALAGLAGRSLCPSWLTETPAFKLLQSLAGGKALVADSSHFGQTLTRILAPVPGLLESRDFAQSAARVLDSAEVNSLAGDALLVGWIQQCLGEKSRRVLAGIAEDACAQSARSRDIEPSLMPSLTQWYTPEWIAGFLVEESVGRQCGHWPGPVVFDPACGAGHLLVPSFEWLVAGQSQASSSEIDEVVARVLQDHIFGCDIDRRAVDLAAFSLYLASRHLAPVGELPLPNLFHFDVDNSRSAIGSLWLGLDAIPPEVCLSNFDGKVSLHASPLNRKFDVVLTNPPYLSHRLMPPEVSAFLKCHYQSGHFDLYGAFIQLAMRLLAPGGRLAMICQQSFMSIQRYERLRAQLTQQCDIECLVQLGAGVFAARAGEKVNNAIIVARRRPEAGETLPGHGNEVRCWRILESHQKALAEERGIAELPVTIVPHSQFAIISGAPFAFWCPPTIARLFREYSPMESPGTGIKLTNGLFTCNNGRFVKAHWQVPPDELSEYVPYDKGGGQKWYRTTPYLLHWGKDGAAIRQYRAHKGQSRSLPGESFYFLPGITYSYIGTRGFRARLLSPGSIFDIASSAVFSTSLDPLYVLGFLNSSLARFLLGVLNPTINFQIGDLRRLPVAIPNEQIAQVVSGHSAAAVELAQRLDAFDSDSPRFNGPILVNFNGDCTAEAAYHRYLDYVEELNRSEEEHQSAIDDLIFDLYEIPAGERAIIESDPWVARERKPLGKPISFKQALEQISSC